MHFQSQNWRFRVFEAGVWKDFQNQLVISNEQTKTELGKKKSAKRRHRVWETGEKSAKL